MTTGSVLNQVNLGVLNESRPGTGNGKCIKQNGDNFILEMNLTLEMWSDHTGFVLKENYLFMFKKCTCQTVLPAPTDNVTITNFEEFLQVNGGRLQHDTDNDVSIKPVEEFLQVHRDDVAMTPVKEFLQSDGNPHKVVTLKGVSKIMELTLDQFENNYKLFAQKLNDIETGLIIRAILLKNNEVIFNYSFKIIGTDNVQNATIAAANKVCNLYLVCALKGNTLICSLGAGHNSICVSITRNVHIANFIASLNKNQC